MQQRARAITTYGKKYSKHAKDKRMQFPQEYFRHDGFAARPALLMSAYNAWNSLSTWREDIRRNEEFVYGDQWSDKVYDVKNCRYITERQMLINQGLQPSQYNIIRNVLRTIKGYWGTNKTLPTVIAQKDENQKESEVLTATLHALYRKNELWKLDLAQLNQMLIAGACVTKNHYANREGESDIVNDYIDPFTFFVDNSMKDPRYNDCTLVGCFHDMSLDDVVGMFAAGNKQRGGLIRELYRGADKERILQMTETFTDERCELSFFVPGIENAGMARVIEVWRKESAECFWVHDYLNGSYYPDFNATEKELKAENRRRIAEQRAMGVADEDMLLLEWEWGTDRYWKYYYMTPMGTVLSEGVNPFWHEHAPIVFELHDFFIGKIYPFVKDLIDANKQINKLSAISELLTRYSAKSLVFFPIDSLASEDGFGLDYVEERMTSFEAVIPYDSSKGNPVPTFINTVAQAFTPLNVVNMYLKLSEQVSGVYGALQGQPPVAGTPAQSFLQQSQNSATSLVGIFEAINSFRVRRDKMNVQLMQQFYKGKRYIFDKDSGKQLVYDEQRVKHIDVEIAVVENTNTPAYRLMMNDILMQLKQFDQNNMLDLRGLVEMGNWPFKDQLLDYLNQREQAAQEAAQQGQVAGQMPPMPEDLQQQMAGYHFPQEALDEFQHLPPQLQDYVMQAAQKHAQAPKPN